MGEFPPVVHELQPCWAEFSPIEQELPFRPKAAPHLNVFFFFAFRLGEKQLIMGLEK